MKRTDETRAIALNLCAVAIDEMPFEDLVKALTREEISEVRAEATAIANGLRARTKAIFERARRAGRKPRRQTFAGRLARGAWESVREWREGA